MSATDNPPGYTPGQGTQNDDGDHNLGWLGLVGLAGLAGLMRRDRNRDVNRHDINRHDVPRTS
jgi:MYXO-CTERM domain-containing protein